MNKVEIPTSDFVQVTAGSIMGYYTATGQGHIGTRTVIGSEIPDHITAQGTAIGTQVTASTTTSYVHLARAIAVQPSKIVLFPIFPVSANYTITVTVTATRLLTSLTHDALVEIEIPVNNTVLSCPLYAATNSTVNITILPHEGKL